MGEGLEGDLFSSKFYLTGTEGKQKLRGKKKPSGQWTEGGGQGSAAAGGGAAFRAEMSKS